ncbi:MAG: shikimate dehydrogenase [Desulfobacterales bacterium]|nr:shikimate dehydrogenase [Desulfobacterales bacterium]
MKIFCILGDERAFRSKSPIAFSTIFKQVGIKGMYVPFKVNQGQIGPAMQSLRVLNIDGANVTVPYKEAVIPHLDILSEGANIIGAINTIVRKDNELKGYNTNAIGFMDVLEEIGFDVADKTALVFGTGGIAKAVVFILNWLRAETIMIAGRNEEHVKNIINRIAGEPVTFESLAKNPVSANIVINATSVSSSDESKEFAALVHGLDVRNCEFVIDVNYGRRENFWQEMAEKKGIPFLDGLPLLAHQASRSFSLWTRIDVDPLDFKKALEEEV